MRERPDPVERRGIGDQAVARHASVAGHSARERRRTTPAAESSRPYRCQRATARSCGDGRCRASARAAGNAVGRHRIAHRTVGGILVRTAHGEFVAVRLAEDNRSGAFQPRDGSRIVWRLVPSRMREPQVVGMPCVLMTSFTAMGTPASEGSASPAAMAASILSAWA